MNYLLAIVVCWWILQCKGMSIYREDNLVLHEKTTSKKLLVRTIRSRSRILAANSRSFQGWTSWETSKGIQMFALNRNGKWFFMSQNRNSFQLVEGAPPTGAVPSSDKRLFALVWIVHNRNVVLKHISSNKFVNISGLRLKLVEDPALASNIEIAFN